MLIIYFSGINYLSRQMHILFHWFLSTINHLIHNVLLLTFLQHLVYIFTIYMIQYLIAIKPYFLGKFKSKQTNFETIENLQQLINSQDEALRPKVKNINKLAFLWKNLCKENFSRLILMLSNMDQDSLQRFDWFSDDC